MAQRGILEYDAKALLSRSWERFFGENLEFEFQSVLAESGDSLRDAAKVQDWLNNPGLVAKPDMLFGKRGKNGLVLFKRNEPGDVSLDDVASWIDAKRSEETTLLSGESGQLTRFIVERFLPHEASSEYYISIRSEGLDDVVSMSASGGVDIEENWDSVVEVKIPVLDDDEDAESLIRAHIPDAVEAKAGFGDFAVGLYRFYKAMHFAYLEMNPFVLIENKVYLLDAVAKVDDTAGFLMREEWDRLQFPTAFGLPEATEEERFIEDLDSKSGSSLKLTILNPKARVWTLVAGGGASVVFADTISELWGAEQLANYGEYSGNPSTEETYMYTRTLLDLMTREKDENGQDKILLIGGAIANFTDVAKTFDGIIQAFEEYAEKMLAVGIRIYVRRGGPNYEIGLKNIRTAAKRLSLPIEVYGPETHMTDIVSISLEDGR